MTFFCGASSSSSSGSILLVHVTIPSAKVVPFSSSSTPEVSSPKRGFGLSELEVCWVANVELLVVVGGCGVVVFVVVRGVVVEATVVELTGGTTELLLVVGVVTCCVVGGFVLVEGVLVVVVEPGVVVAGVVVGAAVGSSVVVVVDLVGARSSGGRRLNLDTRRNFNWFLGRCPPLPTGIITCLRVSPDWSIFVNRSILLREWGICCAQEL